MIGYGLRLAKRQIHQSVHRSSIRKEKACQHVMQHESFLRVMQLVAVRTRRRRRRRSTQRRPRKIRSDPIRPTHRNVSSIVPISVTVTTTKPNRNHGPSRIYRHRCCLPVPFYGHHSLSAVLGLSGPATAPIACPQRLSFVHEDDCRLWCIWIDSIRVCLPGSAER